MHIKNETQQLQLTYPKMLKRLVLLLPIVSLVFFTEMIQKVEGDPPPLWGPQSDEIGKSILAVLQKDPRKFDHVAGRLHGRQLPGSLRSYMWSDVLFKAERKRMKEV